MLFLLPSPSSSLSSFLTVPSALLFYPWRMKDPSYHLPPLHQNSFLCATRDRAKGPPGLFISAWGCLWVVELCLAAGARLEVVLLAGEARGQAVRHQPLLGLFLQARFTLGVFTVSPGFGSILPGGQQMITVDCYAELLGTCREHLSIDISDRDPKDNPLGIPYTLFAESCLPGTPHPQVPTARAAADQRPN